MEKTTLDHSKRHLPFDVKSSGTTRAFGGNLVVHEASVEGRKLKTATFFPLSLLSFCVAPSAQERLLRNDYSLPHKIIVDGAAFMTAAWFLRALADIIISRSWAPSSPTKTSLAPP